MAFRAVRQYRPRFRRGMQDGTCQCMRLRRNPGHGQVKQRHSSRDLLRMPLAAELFGGSPDPGDPVADYLSVLTQQEWQQTDWINPVNLGADPSGVNDSTAAIQLAFSLLGPNGGTVYFPAGLYLISEALTPPSYVVMQGASSHATNIYQAATNTHGLYIDDPNAVTVRDMSITGPADSDSTGNGIYLTIVD